MLQPFTSTAGLLILALAACAASGCAKLPPNEKTYPVHGKVTMAGGGPVPKGAFVYFVAAGAGPLNGRGYIGADGTYRASVYKGQEGLVPGEYKLRVGDSEPEGRASSYTGELSRIPEKYRDAETSGLTLTVRPEDNSYDFELK